MNKKNTKSKKSSKIINIKKNSNYIRKIGIIFIVIVISFALLIGRIAYLQFVEGSYLKERAFNQQSINQIISPKRGSIYDSTGKVLATSATVDTITINPENIKAKKSEDTPALKEKLAKEFSDLFSLDYNETLEKVNSSSQVETIAKKVEQYKVEELKKWLKDNEISSGINIDEDTKRYYPNGSVLSQVIGACGSDNQGLSGIENYWDSTLSGTPGKIVSSKASSGSEIPNSEKSYIPAENGSDLTLTVDFYIQSIVEKYLKQAVDNNNIEHGGDCIVMNPKTGDILAMATYPSYNLNEPFTPNETVAKTYNSLSSEEKANAIYKMWSNKSVSELYEPGSVFKLITASAALEENITKPNIKGDFNCPGYEIVNGVRRINCWKTDGSHGSQTLTQALEHSCNPALMQLGARIGTSTLYKYYKAFGFFDKTGIDLNGEASSIFLDENDVKPIERATYSFGQRFSITPIQMITAISAIANDGVLMKPRIVKSITNTDTGAVTNIDTQEVRQVLSSETAKEMKEMMYSVVENGTGFRGAVTGYSVGGKTGTSEPNPNHPENGYVATYCAISPVEDTQVVLLLNLYKPPVSNHQGGTLAGPVVSQMLSEILPYLGIPSDADNTDDEDLITVPEVRNKTITEAEKVLKDKGFTTKITTENDKNATLVVDQVPKPGATLSKNSIIMLYDQDSRVTTTVPDLTGKGKYQATTELRNSNLNISVEGKGTVVSQDPPKGSSVDAGTVVKVTLK